MWRVVCVWQSCVWKIVRVTKLCVIKLCVKDVVWQRGVWQSCVCVTGRRRRGRRRTRSGIQNQKQEPHTKMWGKKRNYQWNTREAGKHPASAGPHWAPGCWRSFMCFWRQRQKLHEAAKLIWLDILPRWEGNFEETRLGFSIFAPGRGFQRSQTAKLLDHDRLRRFRGFGLSQMRFRHRNSKAKAKQSIAKGCFASEPSESFVSNRRSFGKFKSQVSGWQRRTIISTVSCYKTTWKQWCTVYKNV